MHRLAYGSGLALWLSFAWAAPAQAEIYKWVDEKGVVNYGSEPPKHGNVLKLDTEAARVTIVPGSQPAAAQIVDPNAQVLQRRVERLEQELADERRGRSLAAQSNAEYDQARRDRLRERCERERLVDCDIDPLGARYDTVLIAPLIRRPPHLLHNFHRLHPPIPVVMPERKPVLKARSTLERVPEQR